MIQQKKAVLKGLEKKNIWTDFEKNLTELVPSINVAGTARNKCDFNVAISFEKMMDVCKEEQDLNVCRKQIEALKESFFDFCSPPKHILNNYVQKTNGITCATLKTKVQANSLGIIVSIKKSLGGFERSVQRAIQAKWEKAVMQILNEFMFADNPIICHKPLTKIEDFNMKIEWELRKADEPNETQSSIVSKTLVDLGVDLDQKDPSIVVTHDLSSCLSVPQQQEVCDKLVMELARGVYMNCFANGAEMRSQYVNIVTTRVSEEQKKGQAFVGAIECGTNFLKMPVTGMGTEEHQKQNITSYIQLFGDYRILVNQIQKDCCNILRLWGHELKTPMAQFQLRFEAEKICAELLQSREKGLKKHALEDKKRFLGGLQPHMVIHLQQHILGHNIMPNMIPRWTPLFVSGIYTFNQIMVMGLIGEMATKNMVMQSNRQVNISLFGPRNTGKSTIARFAIEVLNGRKCNPTFEQFQPENLNGASCLISEEYPCVHNMDIKGINPIKDALDVNATKCINVKYINKVDGLRFTPWILTSNDDIASVDMTQDENKKESVRAVESRIQKVYIDDDGTLLDYTRDKIEQLNNIKERLGSEMFCPSEQQHIMLDQMMAFTPFKLLKNSHYVWTDEMLMRSVSALVEFMAHPAHFILLAEQPPLVLKNVVRSKQDKTVLEQRLAALVTKCIGETYARIMSSQNLTQEEKTAFMTVISSDFSDGAGLTKRYEILAMCHQRFHDLRMPNKEIFATIKDKLYTPEMVENDEILRHLLEKLDTLTRYDKEDDSVSVNSMDNLQQMHDQE